MKYRTYPLIAETTVLHQNKGHGNMCCDMKPKVMQYVLRYENKSHAICAAI